MNTPHPLLHRVEEALNTIRPYLETDGGNVEVVEITDELVARIRLLGSCENCSMSHMTMKAGIEKSILRAVPEITAVQAINV